jgi:hypothetical protein
MPFEIFIHTIISDAESHDRLWLQTPILKNAVCTTAVGCISNDAAKSKDLNQIRERKIQHHSVVFHLASSICKVTFTWDSF